MSKQVDEIIAERITEMSERDAKELLAILLFNYRKIGFGNYTKEDCMNDYRNVYREIVLRDMYE
ncbi:hypothetical protein [Aneurinibacillus migulanus]|uniref:hypothetical protein n=1 Tax=Aneurinibacillus migulanus TaxID=47500 RepID=UPI00209FD52C|nr:hypothetical protein [Aneurinibacillus migulanus]MCP1355076.1 hypothetical protein [Aneurinibacillus migulanus]